MLSVTLYNNNIKSQILFATHHLSRVTTFMLPVWQYHRTIARDIIYLRGINIIERLNIVSPARPGRVNRSLHVVWLRK